jgi:hypothetical protein
VGCLTEMGIDFVRKLVGLQVRFPRGCVAFRIPDQTRVPTRSKSGYTVHYGTNGSRVGLSDHFTESTGEGDEMFGVLAKLVPLVSCSLRRLSKLGDPLVLLHNQSFSVKTLTVR